MLGKARIICMIYIVLSSVFLGIDIEVCSANENPAALYPEELWVELDVTTMQRNRIDEIIEEAARAVLKSQDKSQSANMLDILEYESLVNERRMNVNERITQLLTVEQQSIFDSQLQKQEQSKDLSIVALMNLNLSEKQQVLVLHSLIESQKQVWSIIADKRISWEERRKKLKNINAIDKLRKLLTKTQIDSLNVWSDSLNRFNRNNL